MLTKEAEWLKSKAQREVAQELSAEEAQEKVEECAVNGGDCQKADYQ